jgi:hypothetical protein
MPSLPARRAGCCPSMPTGVFRGQGWLLRCPVEVHEEKWFPSRVEFTGAPQTTIASLPRKPVKWVFSTFETSIPCPWTPRVPSGPRSLHLPLKEPLTRTGPGQLGLGLLPGGTCGFGSSVHDQVWFLETISIVPFTSPTLHLLDPAACGVGPFPDTFTSVNTATGCLCRTVPHAVCLFRTLVLWFSQTSPYSMFDFFVVVTVGFFGF